MESIPLVQAARLTVIAFCVFAAVLAGAAWRMSWQARRWGIALSVATAAYSICTSGAFQNTALLIGVTLAFFCACLPAIFWGFVQVLFNDADHFGLTGLAVVAAVGILGVLASDFSGLPDTFALTFSLLRRFAAIGLVGWALWALARGIRGDLVLERWRTRRWLLCLVGAYVLGILIVEIGLPRTVQPGLMAINLFVIGLLVLSLAVALTRWDLTPVPTDPGQPQANAHLPPPALPDEEYAKLIARIEHAMDHEHLYRNEGLSIANFADRLDTQEHRLRRAINQTMGYRNYNDFLHRYRLADAAQRLRDPEQQSLPVLTIALEVGYGSIGPFNRAFKARFGQTPTQYRNDNP